MKIGDFKVVETLGTGAHSTILHVRRSSDARHYALKVVPLDKAEDNKFLEQAQHELRVAEKLDHPNLIKVYGLELQRNWLFRVCKAHLLIEYVNGKTLDTIQGLNLPRLAQIFEKVASGLVHMHRRGVYHADLKPNNIMLSRTGEVKIIDYGLAWIKGENKGRVQGTPEYMAPEQIKQAIVNERTDIFNFGATMYRLTTWRLPPKIVEAESSGLSVDAKTYSRLLKPVKECCPEAPAKLCELIHQCLAFNANQRPERISEVQGRLDHLAEEMVVRPEDRLEAFEF